MFFNNISYFCSLYLFFYRYISKERKKAHPFGQALLFLILVLMEDTLREQKIDCLNNQQLTIPNTQKTLIFSSKKGRFFEAAKIDILFQI